VDFSPILSNFTFIFGVYRDAVVRVCLFFASQPRSHRVRQPSAMPRPLPASTITRPCRIFSLSFQVRASRGRGVAFDPSITQG